MFNRQRTFEVFGYDLDLSVRRRTTDDIEKAGSINKKELLVIDNCPVCGCERTIKLRQSRKNTACSKCFHSSPEMQEAKRNQNKVKSKETKQKMRDNHWSTKGMESAFKGKCHTKSTKRKLSKATKQWYRDASDEEIINRSIKASCTVRGISIEDFNGWATEEGQRLRGTLDYKEFENAVIKRDIKCQHPVCIQSKRSKLTVHHKDGFHWAIDRRTDVDNGVLLCRDHHDEFHNEYGRRNNTEIQYCEWLTKQQDTYSANIKLIVLAGVCGSGKSWIAGQLTDLASYVPYDNTPKEQHLLKIIEKSKSNKGKHIIYDPFRKGGTIYNRYKDVWNVKLIVISEDISVIKQRLLSRDGKISDIKKIEAAISANTRLANKATFSGTSQEVLDYLKKELSNT